MIDNESFQFLNETGMLSQGWNPADRSLLWRYHLHYLDDLTAADADVRLKWHAHLLSRWIAENPPGTPPGWDAYPTSLRIVNWIRWAATSPMNTSAFDDSLATQVRWLASRFEYHILGNHVFANAKALLFAGIYFGGDEGNNWLARGQKSLVAQVREQILADGAHFERSPMYHHIIFEDLLDIVAFFRAYDLEVPGPVTNAVNTMWSWSISLRHSDNNIAFFNDACFGGSPAPEALEAYAAILGFRRPDIPGTALLQDSGFCRLEHGAAVVLVDCGNIGPAYQPGHAHAETLSLECSFTGSRFLVNSGVSEYGTSAERVRQRSTPAHNTLCVDGHNSSGVWSGFRVGRRAHILSCKLDSNSLVASHDGYRHLRGKPVHQRSVSLVEGGIEVQDSVLGDGHAEGTVAVFWHLHPDVDVDVDVDVDQHRARLTSGPSQLDLVCSLPILLQASTWHPRQGQVVPSQMLVLRAARTPDITITTTISW